MVVAMTAVSLTHQQYQQFIDSISDLEVLVATLQTRRSSTGTDPCG